MNTRNRKFEWRPESLKLANEINHSLYLSFQHALKWGLSPDAFYYIVSSEADDIVKAYFEELKYQAEEKIIKETKDVITDI